MRPLFCLLIVLNVASAYSQSIPSYLPKENLVAWFPFDGNAKDHSGNDHHLQVHGPELNDDRLGNPKSAFLFRGSPESAQWLEAENPRPFASPRFTFSVWIKPTAFSPVSIPSFNFNQQSILGYFPANWINSPAYTLNLFQQDNARVHASTWSRKMADPHWTTNSYPSVVSNTIAEIDQWLHVAVTYDGAALILYANGVQIATRKSTLSYEHQVRFIIGGGIWSHESNIMSGFQGIIDDVGFWDRVLSEKEIEQVYHSAGLQGIVRDIDGNSYQTTFIDGEEWMAQNLLTTHFANGDPIPYVADRCDWSFIASPAYCYPENDEKYTLPYGRLYNWFAVADKRNICPVGWHTPSDIEMKRLIMHADPHTASNLDVFGEESSSAAHTLKDSGTTYWAHGSDTVANESGFALLPAGHREFYGAQTFTLGRYAYLWTTTAKSGWQAWLRSMDAQSNTVARHYADKRAGFSVRCVKGEADPSFNSPPTDITLSATVIADNVQEKSPVGIIATNDNEGGDFLYSLPTDSLHTDNASFDLGSLTIGHLKTLCLSATAISKPEYLVRIRAIDGGGLSFEKEFKITVESGLPSFLNLGSISLFTGLILSALSLVVLTKAWSRQTLEAKQELPTFERKEEGLIRAFKRNPNQNLTLEEVNMILGTFNKSIEVQKKHRSDTIRSINKKYTDHTGENEKLLSQERLETDKRLARYIMDPDKYRKIEALLTAAKSNDQARPS
jgi:uncharacterized protein (TIGR02145 family)